MTDTRVARALFAATSLFVTLGLVLHCYPYPFMNVGEHGYPVVLLNVTLVAVLFLTISSGALALDRRLPGGRVH